MNESLVHLYELQKIDSTLDELRENRGELPEQVEQIKRKAKSQKEALESVRAYIKDVEKRSKALTDDSVDLREKVEKYKGQQFDVKTTREYDAITFQLEDGQKRLSKNLEDAGRMGIELEQQRKERDQLEKELKEIEHEMSESETTLDHMMAETQEEEDALEKKRKKLLKQIAPHHMSIYNRVRPAKNGIAVVPIKNGVCGGCFNAIPRQLVLELKRGEKHTVCEYCGRIVVGEPISQSVDGIPEPVAHE